MCLFSVEAANEGSGGNRRSGQSAFAARRRRTCDCRRGHNGPGIEPHRPQAQAACVMRCAAGARGPIPCERDVHIERAEGRVFSYTVGR